MNNSDQFWIIIHIYIYIYISRVSSLCVYFDSHPSIRPSATWICQLHHSAYRCIEVCSRCQRSGISDIVAAWTYWILPKDGLGSKFHHPKWCCVFFLNGRVPCSMCFIEAILFRVFVFHRSSSCTCTIYGFVGIIIGPGLMYVTGDLHPKGMNMGH